MNPEEILLPDADEMPQSAKQHTEDVFRLILNELKEINDNNHDACSQLELLNLAQDDCNKSAVMMNSLMWALLVVAVLNLFKWF